MSAAVLVRPSEGEAIYDGVVALAKTARQTVGFLPDSAFAQRAAQGTLLAAVENDEVAGYILYDLPRDEVRVVHLVIAPKDRGCGLAHLLVDSVARDHAERRGMVLHCRNDFPAHHIWDRLDFLPVGERPGKSIEGKPLTRWFRSFGRPDLFTYLQEADARPIATMDACVFFDLVALLPSQLAQQLRADWLGEHVRLAVADQLFVEIRDGRHPSERKRQRAAAQPFRLAATPRPTWWPVYQQFLEVHPHAPTKDHNDLIHMAQSVALGARWLITTDGPLAKHYGAAAADLHLQLVSPSEFVREVDEQARGDRYRPVDLVGTSVTRREVDAGALPELPETFVNHQQNERLRDLRQRIYLAAARPATARLEVIEVDREPRGLVAWQTVDGTLEVMLLRATTGRGETTIGRHLLALVRDEAVDSGVETVRIVDPTPSATVQRSLRDEGFAGSPSVAHALVGRGTLAELRQCATALGSPLANGHDLGDCSEDLPERAARAERWFAPVRVLGAGIPAFVVPIQHGWATRLLDVGLSDDQLFPRDWGLGLRRELVYYRSPRNAGGLAAPARLLWYVSGTAPGSGTIRAVSHLTEVAVGDQDRLFHRFKPLGVYGRDDVHGRADEQGQVMALRFCNTERFAEPVSLDDYRRLMAGDPKSRSVVLRSARRVSEHVFVSLLEMGVPQ